MKHPSRPCVRCAGTSFTPEPNPVGRGVMFSCDTEDCEYGKFIIQPEEVKT